MVEMSEPLQWLCAIVARWWRGFPAMGDSNRS